MALKLRKRSLFPALVQVQSPLILTKNGAVYTFSFDLNSITGAQTFANVTITPPATSLSQGLVITQSGPNSSSTPGPFNYNSITVSDGNFTVTGSGADSYGMLNADGSAFRVNYSIGTSDSAPRLGGVFALKYTGTGGAAQPVGVIGSAVSATNPDSLWGVIGNSVLQAGGTGRALFPVTSEIAAATGTTLQYRCAYSTVTEGAVQGSVVDTVHYIVGQNVGYGTPAGFKNIFYIDNTGGTVPCIDANANFLHADSATTFANIFDCFNVTVTGYFANFPNFFIAGSGIASFKNSVQGQSAIVTSGGTTVLTLTSNRVQYFTGSSNHTVTLPVVSTLVLNTTYEFVNDSTGTITVNSSGGNALLSIPAGGRARAICISLTGTTAASWTYEANFVAVAGGKLVTFNNRLTFSGTDGSTVAFGAGGTVAYGGGQIPGTATNDNASSGNVGEYVESVIPGGSAVSLVTATPKDVTSITLTAGDWDVDCVAQFNPAASTQFTALAVSLSLTANNMDVTPGRYFNVPQGTITGGGFSFCSALPNYRFSLSATTTIHLCVQASFSVSTMTAQGIIRARRIR